jgi:hypothetical protein
MTGLQAFASKSELVEEMLAAVRGHVAAWIRWRNYIHVFFYSHITCHP